MFGSTIPVAMSQTFVVQQQHLMSQSLNNLQYCTDWPCPSWEVAFSRSGALREYEMTDAGSWPLIFGNNVIYVWWLVYLCVGAFAYYCIAPLMRRYKRQQQHFHGALAVEDEEEILIVRRYLPSFLHAVMASVICIIALRNAHAIEMMSEEAGEIGLYFAMLHSFGYFLADCIVDRDIVYIPHHIIPLLCAEVLLRYQCSLYFAIWLGLLCELSNVLCHGCLLWYRDIEHPHYQLAFKFINLLLRGAAAVCGVLMIHCDIPAEHLRTAGPIVALLILSLFCTNVFAVLAVTRNSKTSSTAIGASVGTSCCSFTSIFSFGANKDKSTSPTSIKTPIKPSKREELVIIEQRHPTVSPYIQNFSDPEAVISDITINQSRPTTSPYKDNVSNLEITRGGTTARFKYGTR